jgi:hypothetical protein
MSDDDEDCPIPLRAPKQRALLALLFLRRDEQVFRKPALRESPAVAGGFARVPRDLRGTQRWGRI